MNFYQESSRKIPIKESADVIVAGAGPAGIAAALSSARMGSATVIVEQQGTVGGIATSGLMSHWTGRANSKIYKEILYKSATLNEGEFAGIRTTIIDPEKLKTLFLDLLLEAGVKIRLYTFASDAIIEGGKINGIITESKSGREALSAKVIIDATGDGDIAAMAGAEFVKGRKTDGKMQPATIMFKVAGVDYANAIFLGSFESTYETEKGELQSLAKKHIPSPAGHVLLYKTTLPGVVTCNMTNCIDVDGTSAEDLTRASIVCRKQIDNIIRFLREFVPGYEKCFAISSASLIGIRETRHFNGVYTLTEDDILEAKQFDDWVVRDAYFNFDVHNLTGSGLDKTGAQQHFKQSMGYTIPYGCLVPEKLEGLLLAGRNISGTHLAHSNYRAMPICVALGEAAGIAAALKCKNGGLLREINPVDIQEFL